MSDVKNKNSKYERFSLISDSKKAREKDAEIAKALADAKKELNKQNGGNANHN